MGVCVTPRAGHAALKVKVKRIIRPIPDSLISTFKSKFVNMDFKALNGFTPSQMVKRFQSELSNILCQTFPEKQIVISPYDLPWFNEELRKLRRRKQRAYENFGKNDKYEYLNELFEARLRAARLKFKEKIEEEVKNGKRGSSYPIIRQMGTRPFESIKPDFHLPAHAVRKLSPAQSAEVIAEHFAKISQEMAPLNVSRLPLIIQHFLKNYDRNDAPGLTTADVYTRIKKAKKPNSSVPGDLPKKLVQHCANVLAIPASIIFNQITRTADFPAAWKIEHQIPIPKVVPPECEDDLRNIAKTAFLSKIYESFVGSWLLPIIKPYLDPGQCGLKGLSITHYLIKLLNFIHSTLDLKKPHSVLAACVDISKAFNRVDHTLVIQDLYDMHTPAWLLNIVISYLSERSMVVTYNNAKSSKKTLPGGGPQGAYLGGIIFIIKYNGAFLRPPVP